jgi:hypothetical protein
MWQKMWQTTKNVANAKSGSLLPRVSWVLKKTKEHIFAGFLCVFLNFLLFFMCSQFLSVFFRHVHGYGYA